MSGLSLTPSPAAPIQKWLKKPKSFATTFLKTLKNSTRSSRVDHPDTAPVDTTTALITPTARMAHMVRMVRLARMVRMARMALRALMVPMVLMASMDRMARMVHMVRMARGLTRDLMVGMDTVLHRARPRRHPALHLRFRPQNSKRITPSNSNIMEVPIPMLHMGAMLRKYSSKNTTQSAIVDLIFFLFFCSRYVQLYQQWCAAQQATQHGSPLPPNNTSVSPPPPPPTEAAPPPPPSNAPPPPSGSPPGAGGFSSVCDTSHSGSISASAH